MPEQFWVDQYTKKAALSDAVAQSGRGSRFDAVEFLYVVRSAIQLLNLHQSHDLLDVGCSNGLVDIPLSASCRGILAIDPVPEQVSLARQNLIDCPNVLVKVGHGADIPAPDGSFDRVLVLNVVQLVSSTELAKVFRELRRVTRPSGVILLGTVPDARRRDAFLGPYLEGVRAATHLSEEQKEEIIARNLNSHWHDPADLTSMWEELGGRAQLHPLPASDPNSQQRFHMTVHLEG